MCIRDRFISFQGLAAALATWAAVSAARTIMLLSQAAPAAVGASSVMYGYGRTAEATGLMKL